MLTVRDRDRGNSRVTPVILPSVGAFKPGSPSRLYDVSRTKFFIQIDLNAEVNLSILKRSIQSLKYSRVRQGGLSNE